jgi:hypothetical protein
MKGVVMSRKHLLPVALLAAVAVALGTFVTAGAGAASSGNQLAGTWQATVNRPAPLPPLRSMQIFTSDGSGIEVSNEPPATRSPLYSSWERIGGRLYAASGEHFLFEPQSGAFAGVRRIDRTIELSQDGQSFAVVARVTTLDASGNVVGTFIARASAVRMPVERIPDRP